MVRALRMEAYQVGFAFNAVLKAELRKLAVGGVDVVQVDILDGAGDNLALCNIGRGQEEHGRVAHEVLDIVQAELGLHGDFSRAEILVKIKHVHKRYNVGYGLAHGVKLIQYHALGAGECHLPRFGLGCCQRAGVQESEEVCKNVALQFVHERSIALFDCNGSAVFCNLFKGYSMRVLFDVDVSLKGFGNSVFAVGDNRACGYSVRGQGHTCSVGCKASAGRFPYRAHDAEDIPQCFPVLGEARYKINFARYNVGIYVGQV